MSKIGNMVEMITKKKTLPLWVHNSAFGGGRNSAFGGGRNSTFGGGRNS